jgi:hypothetical protein
MPRAVFSCLRRADCARLPELLASEGRVDAVGSGMGAAGSNDIVHTVLRKDNRGKRKSTRLSGFNIGEETRSVKQN